MCTINEDLWNGGSAAAFLDHLLSKRWIIINIYLFYFLSFFVQQAYCHDAIWTEAGAVHAYPGHI